MSLSSLQVEGFLMKIGVRLFTYPSEKESLLLTVISKDDVVETDATKVLFFSHWVCLCSLLFDWRGCIQSIVFSVTNALQGSTYSFSETCVQMT